MKFLTSTLAAHLFALTCMLFNPGTSLAQTVYHEHAYLYDRGANWVNTGEGRQTLSPTAKIILKDGVPGRALDLRKGDFVKLTVFRFNKKFLVDRVGVLPSP